MTARRSTRLYLRTGTRQIAAGHPWVYRDADVRALGPLATSAVVDVHDAASGDFLARGLHEAESDVAVRLFTWDPAQDVGLDLALARVDEAVARRERFDLARTDALRLVNGEGDGLPGLVADRYGAFAVLQPYAALWRPWLEPLARRLAERAGLEGVLLRRRVRHLRGGGPPDGHVLHGKAPPDAVRVREDGLTFVAEPRAGQKTGMFLDQRDNRAAVARFCRGARVLNLFAYTGGFSVHAAAAGARAVVSVDSAPDCAKAASRNFEANGLGSFPHRFEVGDAFAWLERNGERFDVVIVDPPSFASARAQVEAASKSYVRLLRLACGAVERGGLAAFCSCTAQVGEAAFLELVGRACAEAGREAAIVAVRGLPDDHPTLAALPESRYLKCVLARLD